ncbi:hypothetical protein BABINDRAFT_164722 [Babjeviella inositovora NRRL Y-12698]|uniref:Uncharacterized protein n=1 Tax=Babjeviella inositovora NRRL Y-12698 TaxID=984486 RepID=A0A1E3R0U3_9ASCO|nr:uncharacterized protein BABINDRAFT_164722 [Babjeviella inositovora NRRL Y-12698]ODQ83007.1 hypothetical protein BABINDRAFT_164722 [Babjeviella inositovora NRRL Y-12698]
MTLNQPLRRFSLAIETKLPPQHTTPLSSPVVVSSELSPQQPTSSASFASISTVSSANSASAHDFFALPERQSNKPLNGYLMCNASSSTSSVDSMGDDDSCCPLRSHGRTAPLETNEKAHFLLFGSTNEEDEEPKEEILDRRSSTDSEKSKQRHHFRRSSTAIKFHDPVFLKFGS